jgi:hypothetical protein
MMGSRRQTRAVTRTTSRRRQRSDERDEYSGQRSAEAVLANGAAGGGVGAGLRHPSRWSSLRLQEDREVTDEADCWPWVRVKMADGGVAENSRQRRDCWN